MFGDNLNFVKQNPVWDNPSPQDMDYIRTESRHLQQIGQVSSSAPEWMRKANRLFQSFITSICDIAGGKTSAADISNKPRSNIIP